MSKARSRPKHIPQRTCVVCRTKHDKRSLTRIVNSAEGVVIDLTGKKNGRGAYLCSQSSCWQTAATSKALDQALKTDLTQKERAALAAGPVHLSGSSQQRA